MPARDFENAADDPCVQLNGWLQAGG
jgi:hypothetical protein